MCVCDICKLNDISEYLRIISECDIMCPLEFWKNGKIICQAQRKLPKILRCSSQLCCLRTYVQHSRKYLPLKTQKNVSTTINYFSFMMRRVYCSCAHIFFNLIFFTYSFFQSSISKIPRLFSLENKNPFENKVHLS